MKSFADDLNKIKAEETLKEKTKAFVRTELVKSEYGRRRTVRTGTSQKGNPFMKKFVGAISAVAACALLAAGGFVLYATPVNYVSFDINPSVELGVNAFDKVVSAQAYNDDGESLLAGVHVRNLSLQDAINGLVEQAGAQGYVRDDGSSVIAVTAESNNEQTAARLQTSCENTITLTLNKGETTAVVYTDAITLHFAHKARELGVSPGKYKLIQVLQSLDPTITVEQYKDAKISEIIAAGNALLGNQPGNNGNGNGQGNGSGADALQRIRNAAKKAQKLYGTLGQSGTIGQSGNVTIGQSGNMTIGQSGNGNQNKNQDKTSSKQAKKQEKEREKEQKKEEKGKPATASPATPANNGNGNGNGFGNNKNPNQCISSCSGVCSVSCSSPCPSLCTSSGSGSFNGNNGAGTGGNKGKG